MRNLGERGVEAEASFHADCEHVECVRKGSRDLLLSLLPGVAQQQVWQEEPYDRAEPASNNQKFGIAQAKQGALARHAG